LSLAAVRSGGETFGAVVSEGGACWKPRSVEASMPSPSHGAMATLYTPPPMTLSALGPPLQLFSGESGPFGFPHQLPAASTKPLESLLIPAEVLPAMLLVSTSIVPVSDNVSLRLIPTRFAPSLQLRTLT